MANRPGIYRILNLRNGKSYVGSSVDAPKRMSVHSWLLRRKEHHSPQLQRSWDRDGASAFSFAIIERCEKANLIKREQIWINHLQSYDDRFGYNVGAVAGSREGVPQPLTYAARMRLLHTGVPKSAEHRAKIGAGNRGKIRSEKTKAALRAAAALQYASEDARNIAAAFGAKASVGGNPFKGKSHSTEAKATMSEKARLRAKDPGVRKRLLSNLKCSPEHYARLGKANGERLRGQPRVDLRQLTAEQVLEIRAAKHAGATYDQLVERFGMDRGSLHSLVTGKTYKII